ncbi:MAG: hypothetical protein HYV16_02470 [Gammaproteobacteria bacterium]|nr:hypothetical protein [Gammaproteobacteria bacterium]
MNEWLWSANAAPGSILGKLRAMRTNIRRFILSKRRSERRYARTVKMSKTRYPVKKNAAQLLN